MQSCRVKSSYNSRNDSQSRANKSKKTPRAYLAWRASFNEMRERLKGNK